jgi:hypothetical protein
MKQKELVMAPTGNSDLDSLVSGFNMFGIAPELAEMMRQASQMTQEEEPEPVYSYDTGKKSSSEISFLPLFLLPMSK